MNKSTKEKALPQPVDSLNLKDLPTPDVPVNLNDKPPAPLEEQSNAEPDKQAKVKKDKSALITRMEKYLSKRWQFRYNVLKNGIEFVDVGKSHWIECDERAARRLEYELLKTGFTGGVGHCLDVFLSNAPDFNPIIAYLEKLPAWDGETDHISHLADFVEVEPKRRDWWRRMFKKHLVRLLACASGRLSFNKHCLTLVSNQNDGKTSFLRFLCPPEWREFYSEDIDFGNKDGLVSLARNIFLNLDELKSLRQQDINKVKSFLSQDRIKARLPFDRRETNLRRVATFFASTNAPEFLTDETGSVRWLVFEVKNIRHDNGKASGYGAQVDINLIWSQAFALLNNGFEYQLTREEITESERLNMAHTRLPTEYELILQYYDVSKDPSDFKATSDIVRHISNKTFLKVSAEGVGKAMGLLKAERHSRRPQGRSIRGYLLKERDTAKGWDSDEMEE
jgi:predicted P-loop ATPase